MPISMVVWISSYVVALVVAWIIRASLFSNYTMFIGFSLVYTLFPLLVSAGIQPTYFYNSSLNFRYDLIDIHLIVTGFANIAYCLGRLIGYRRQLQPVPRGRPAFLRTRVTQIDNIIMLGFMVFAIALTLAGMQFRWGYARSELVNSLLGQGKVILSGVYAYFLVFYGLRPRTIFMLCFVVIITFFEGSRTSLIAMTIGTLIVAQEDRAFSRLTLLLFTFAFVLYFIFIAMYRIGYDTSSISQLLDATFPIFIEGTYGSYMNLQVYDLVIARPIDYTYFLNYLVDPVVFSVPRPLFIAFGLDKDSFTIFQSWIANETMRLQEPFAPYGGFFYVAEASAALPYVGPAIVAFGFALLTAWAENRRKLTIGGRFQFVIFTIGFSMVFIKHHFAGSTRFYFTTFIVAYGIYLLNHVVTMLLQRRAARQSAAHAGAYQPAEDASTAI
ncbi:MAG TPA: hypothetical protein VGD58_19285 [Herpetosiphonaceae bacterium]